MREAGYILHGVFIPATGGDELGVVKGTCFLRLLECGCFYKVFSENEVSYITSTFPYSLHKCHVSNTLSLVQIGRRTREEVLV